MIVHILNQGVIYIYQDWQQIRVSNIEPIELISQELAGLNKDNQNVKNGK